MNLVTQIPNVKTIIMLEFLFAGMKKKHVLLLKFYLLLLVDCKFFMYIDICQFMVNNKKVTYYVQLKLFGHLKLEHAI